MPKVSIVPAPEIDTAHLAAFYVRVSTTYEAARKATTQAATAKTRAEHYAANEQAQQRAKDRAAERDRLVEEFAQVHAGYLSAYNAAYEALPFERKAWLLRNSNRTTGTFWDLRRHFESVPDAHNIWAALNWMPEEDAEVPGYYLVFRVTLRPNGRRFVNNVTSVKDGVIAVEGIYSHNLEPGSQTELIAHAVVEAILSAHQDEWPDVKVDLEIMPAGRRVDL